MYSTSKRLQILRQRANLSQSQLAAKLGKDPSEIMQWENSISFPNGEELNRLANIYNISIDELMRGDIDNESFPSVYTDEYKERQAKHRKQTLTMRIFGFVLLGIGLPLLIAGLVLFFMGFSGKELNPPFLPFLFLGPGASLLPLSLFLISLSYARRVSRYMKDEYMPTHKEMYYDLKPEIKDFAQTIKGDDHVYDEELICPKCGTRNELDSKFCKNCGNTLITKRKCPTCGNTIDADSLFCPQCGRPLSK